METYGSFLAATIIGLAIAFLTWFAARKSGLTSAQAELIDTLQQNTLALNEQVRLLRAELEQERAMRRTLETKVRRLEEATVDLAAENSELRRRITPDA